jgi:hypothetical protein
MQLADAPRLRVFGFVKNLVNFVAFAGYGALVAVCAGRLEVAEGGGGYGRAAWRWQLQHCVQQR